MPMKRKTVIGGAVIATVVAVGSGIAVAANRGGDDQPLTGTTLDRASAAAVAYVGGGRVTESEVGDGDAAYEVEVAKDDGTVVEVSLDAGFHVIGTEDEGGDGDDEVDESDPEDDSETG